MTQPKKQDGRILVILPERHDRGREQEATNLARTFVSQGATLALFIEGVRTSQIKSATEELGFPIRSIEHDEIKDATNSVSRVVTLSRLNAFVFALSHQTDSRSQQFFRQISTATAGLGSGKPQTTAAKDMLKILLNDAIYSAPTFQGVMSIDEFKELVDTTLQRGGHGIAPHLRAFIVQWIEEWPQNPGILKTVEDANAFFLAQYGFRIDIPATQRDLSCTTIAKALETNHPISVEAAITQLANGLRVFREIYMVHAILKDTDWEVGVLNIGANHLSSPNFMGPLGRTGISISVAPY